MGEIYEKSSLYLLNFGKNGVKQVVGIDLFTSLSVTWEQSCQCHVGAIVTVSFWNNRTSYICQQSCQCHMGIIDW